MDNKFLASFVRSYNIQKRKRAEADLAYYKSLPTLDEIINLAALSIAPNGKRSPHQRRLKKIVLEMVKNNLLEKQQSLRASKTFDDVKQVVEDCAVLGFGRLTVYDTSLKIGAWLGLMPSVVYLHAGTREGARTLRLDASKHFLRREELPEPLRDMEPYHVENFLCIFKDKLKNPFSERIADCAPDAKGAGKAGC